MAASSVDSISELMEKVTFNDFGPGNTYWVDITHINHPQSFYARPTAYRRYLDDVQICGDPMKPEDVHIRNTVVYHSKILNKYIRGLIIFIENNEETTTGDIFAIDYGFFEKSLVLDDLFKPKTCGIPPLAMHCQLADCKPLGQSWTEREIDAIKGYVGEERAKMFVREKGSEILTVELINSLPDDIATMLALTGYSHMGYGANEISKLTSPKPRKLYFTHKELKPNERLHVRLQTGRELSSFFVAEKKDYKYFLNERENFTYHSKKQKSLTEEDLAVDKPVAVLDVYNKYERGIIKEILPDSKVKVQLIDWGTMIEEHISALKTMSEKFFHYPAVAVYCTLGKEQLKESKYRSYLYPGYELKIEVLEAGEGFTVPAVVKILPFK